MLDLLDYWQGNPPLHRLVAAYLGIEEQDEEDHQVMNREELEAWMRSMM